MKRKVVKHGPSTFIISLPAKWVKAHDVQKGDSLEVLPRGNTLVVSQRLAEDERVLTIDLTGQPEELVQESMRAAYRQGYDRLEITHGSTQTLSAIQDSLNELLGFAIMEQDDKNCTVQAISREVDLTFDESLNETYEQVHELLQTAAKAFKAGDRDTIKALPLKAQGITKLTNFCLRTMHQSGKSPTIELRPDIACEIEELGAIGRTAKGLSEDFSGAYDEITGQGLEEIAAMAKAIGAARQGRTGIDNLIDQKEKAMSRLADAKTLGAAKALCIADRLWHLGLSHVIASSNVHEASQESSPAGEATT